jgi:hypothetical protein
MHPLAYAAGIGVMNKPPFPIPLQRILQDLADNTIAKIGGKDLPKFGLLEKKTDRTRGMVRPPVRLLAEPYQMFLQMHVKPEGRRF